MPERITMTGMNPEGMPPFEEGGQLGVRGHPATIVSVIPSAADPGLFDLVVDVAVPEPQPDTEEAPAS